MRLHLRVSLAAVAVLLGGKLIGGEKTIWASLVAVFRATLPVDLMEARISLLVASRDPLVTLLAMVV